MYFSVSQILPEVYFIFKCTKPNLKNLKRSKPEPDKTKTFMTLKVTIWSKMANFKLFLSSKLKNSNANPKDFNKPDEPKPEKVLIG